MNALVFLTDFADQGVVLPLIAAVAITLVLSGHRRLACGWIAATGGVLGAMLLLKVVCYTCGLLIPALNLPQLGLVSPSGHVAAACIAYSGIVALMTAGQRHAACRFACLTAVGVAAIVGTTRVELGDHSWGEVAIGAAVGIAGAVGFTMFAARPGGRVSSMALLSTILPVLLICHGMHFTIEHAIHSASAEMLKEWDWYR